MHEGSRKPYSAKRRLAAEVAAEHAAELRDGDVALVDEHQRVVGHVFEQRRRRLAGLAAGEIARIVLDAGAAPGRLHHLEVVERALLEPLRLQQAAGGVELVEPPAQLLLDAGDRLQQRRARRDVVRVGVDLDEFELVGLLPGERVELVDRFDLVAEQRHPPGAVLVVGGENLDHVAAHPERAAEEVAGRALVLQRHQVGDQRPLVDAVALLDREGHRRIGLDRADAVDARHRGHDDDVVALEQRARRRVAHAVDLLVDRGFLLDIGVGARDVGLGLVVVVVADEILDRVVGEERPELAVELRRQRLVGGEHQRRPLGLLDHLRHREGLAGAGDAEQHLGAVAALDALDQVGDRLRLIPLRIEAGLDDQPPAALRFLRPRRAVRRPRPLAELRPAFAQQSLEGIDGRGRAGDATEGGDTVLVRARRFGRLVALEAERLRELGIDAQRRRAQRRGPLPGIARLRRLAEALHGRLARPVRGGKVGAAVERVVGRRLEPGLRARPGSTLADARIEQLGQRRIGRRLVGPCRLGAGRLRRVLLRMLGRIALNHILGLARFARLVGGFRHRRNMERPL